MARQVGYLQIKILGEEKNYLLLLLLLVVVSSSSISIEFVCDVFKIIVPAS